MSIATIDHTAPSSGVGRATASVSKKSYITKALLLERLGKHGAAYAAPMFPFCYSTPETYNEVMADKDIHDSVKSSFLWDYPLECPWDESYFSNNPVPFAKRPENLPSKAWIQQGITADDQEVINQYFLKFPDEIKVLVWEQYCRVHNSLGGKQANLFLKTLDAGKWSKSNFSEGKKRLAAETEAVINKEKSMTAKIKAGRGIFEREGLSCPWAAWGTHRKGTLLRMVDIDVWDRKLRKRGKQLAEKTIRDAGRIFRKGQVYTSDHNVNGYIEMQKSGKEFLKRQQVISDAGDELSLAKMVAKTVSNPANRRNEMMMRINGLEEVAEGMGMICLFVTFTSASIYHPKRFIKQGDNGEGYFIANPNYQPILRVANKDESIKEVRNTPKESNDFIKRVVNRSTAKIKREGIEYTGYRTVEPHHDGTSHWHMAFFVHPEYKKRVSKIFTHYALKEYGDEKGAKTHRIKIKDHDKKKGSAAGYMSKYISKGISGDDVGEDYESGLDAKDSSVRILAWKSLWCIRQFGFFGSPSVTVWRELRRIHESLANPTMEKLRLIADEGRWSDFIQLMKELGQKGTRIKIEKIAVEDANGIVKKNKYHEIVKRVLGLRIEGISGSEVIKTRFKQWFLVDLERLEKRVIRGLPFQHREDSYYLEQVKEVVKKAVEYKKVRRLHQGTGGVVPFAVVAMGTAATGEALGPVCNNVTGDG